jgi:formylglycine-generating enzyme required for sulfatase activity
MVQECGVNELIFDDSKANINFARYASSVPVDTYAQGKLYDVIGNVWQWTQTQMDALDGFEVHPWYDDFSEPTFDGKHNVIKGGSWASTGNEIMMSARYAFRRHFIQHAGFRYVVGDGESESKKYEHIKQMHEIWKKRYG